MENKQSLNKENENNEIVRKQEKKLYKQLGYYLDNTKLEIDVKRQKKKCKVTEQEEADLVSNDYLQWNENKDTLHDFDYKVTKKGYETYCKLEEKYKSDWSKYSNMVYVVAFVISLITIYYTGKSQGWW